MNEIELVSIMLDELFFENDNLSSSMKNGLLVKFMRNDLPYCVSSIIDNEKKISYFQNREYNPLGVFGYTGIDFGDEVKIIKCRGFYGIDEIPIDSKEKEIYFYDDSCKPFSGNKLDLIHYLMLLKYFLLVAQIKTNEISEDKALDEFFIKTNNVICKLYKKIPKIIDYKQMYYINKLKELENGK